MRILFFSVLSFLALFAFGQEHDFNGLVESKEQGIPLHGAHVINLSSQTLTTSGPKGNFEIRASAGDTLKITYVGYQPILLVVTDANQKSRTIISLKPMEVVLEDVVVTPFPDYWDFKQMVLDASVPDSALNIPLPKVAKYAFYDPRSAPIESEIPPPAIGIPFDLSGLLKQSREKKKLQQKVEKELKWQRAHQKFNRDWVGEVTLLEGDELTDFLAFCNFSADHIIETHLIELKEEVLALLFEFKTDQLDSASRHRPG